MTTRMAIGMTIGYWAISTILSAIPGAILVWIFNRFPQQIFSAEFQNTVLD